MSGPTPRPPLSHDEVVDLAPLYVLGALEPAEEAAVREHLATCEIGHPELDELGGVVSALWETVELVEPPASLKQRVLDAVRAEGAVQPTAAPAEERVTRFPTAQEREERTFRPTRFTRTVDWMFRAAAILAIVVLGAWNLLLQRDLDQARDYRDAVAAVLDVAGQQGSAIAVVAPTGDSPIRPSGIAAVSSGGRVEFAVRGLAPTSGTQVYTAWAIGADGVPVDIGDLAIAPDGSGRLTTQTSTPPANLTVAFTLEDRSGATAPKAPILAAGKAVTQATA